MLISTRQVVEKSQKQQKGTTLLDREFRQVRLRGQTWCSQFHYSVLLVVWIGFSSVSAARERISSKTCRARDRIGISGIKLSSQKMLAGVHKSNSILYIPSHSNPNTQLHRISRTANTRYPTHLVYVHSGTLCAAFRKSVVQQAESLAQSKSYFLLRIRVERSRHMLNAWQKVYRCC